MPLNKETKPIERSKLAITVKRDRQTDRKDSDANCWRTAILTLYFTHVVILYSRPYLFASLTGASQPGVAWAPGHLPVALTDRSPIWLLLFYLWVLEHTKFYNTNAFLPVMLPGPQPTWYASAVLLFTLLEHRAAWSNVNMQQLSFCLYHQINDTRYSALLVFISLMRFLWQNLVSWCFLVCLGNFFLILFNFFSNLLVWCNIPKYLLFFSPSFLILSEFGRFISSVICPFSFLIMSMTHFSMPNSIPIS